MNEDRDTMQIYTIIRKLEKVIDDSPRSKLSSNGKRMMDADALVDLLGDLKVSIPDDIRRAYNVINEADTVLASADEHARSVIESAERRAALTIDKANAKAEHVLKESYDEFEIRVSEHQIYMEAQKRGQLLIRKAEANAQSIIDSAKRKADATLAQLCSNMEGYWTAIDEDRRNLYADKNDISQASALPKEEVTPVAQEIEFDRPRSSEEKPPEPKPSDTKEKFFLGLINKIKDRLSTPSEEEANESFFEDEA